MIGKIWQRARAGKSGPQPATRGTFSRSRGLEKFAATLGPGLVEAVIDAAIARGGAVRVLEIGCGEGRLLLELRKLYPRIELHGINRRAYSGMTGPESFVEVATYHKIFTEREARGIELPRAHFYSAEKLRFDDHSFDLIVSQVAIPYVNRKTRLLEEVWRVLKTDGQALLNLDSIAADLPDFLNFDAPRMIIYDGQENLPLAEFFARIRDRGFAIDHEIVPSQTREGRHWINLKIIKNREQPLSLGLEFDQQSSFALKRLQNKKGDRSYAWGFRSVYRMG